MYRKAQQVQVPDFQRTGLARYPPRAMLMMLFFSVTAWKQLQGYLWIGLTGSVEDARRLSAGRGVLRLQAATREGWHKSKKRKNQNKVTSQERSMFAGEAQVLSIPFWITDKEGLYTVILFKAKPNPIWMKWCPVISQLTLHKRFAFICVWNYRSLWRPDVSPCSHPQY